MEEARIHKRALDGLKGSFLNVVNVVNFAVYASLTYADTSEK